MAVNRTEAVNRQSPQPRSNPTSVHEPQKCDLNEPLEICNSCPVPPENRHCNYRHLTFPNPN